MATGAEADAVSRAGELLARSERVLLLTGAGISTDSGIPDFRGPNGLWTNDPEAEKVSDIVHFLRSSEIRRRSWRGYLGSPARRARPNAGHLALVEVERRGVLLLLVTQNTDGLHLATGHDPSRVVEIHGSSATTTCRSCGATWPTNEIAARVVAGDEDPRCTVLRAGRPCGGILKRNTVLFGEPLPVEALARGEAAAATCDLLLAVGTTLSVYPAAGLVPLAARRGAPVVIVNGAPTEMDAVATVIVRSPISEALPAIVRASFPSPAAPAG